MDCKLSILIPSLVSRIQSREFLLKSLQRQIKIESTLHYIHPNYETVVFLGESAEVIVITDRKAHSTGEKRNMLLDLASGEYVCFIDDDDFVDENYIELILNAIKKGSDTIGISGIITTNGDNKVDWELSKNFQNRTVKRGGKIFYERKTNHLSPVKRELAMKAKFPDKSNAEDKAYSDALNQFLKTETKIEKPIYHYRYSTKNKEYV